MIAVAVLLAAPSIGRAQGSSAAEIEKANAFAMENYDLGDYGAARDIFKVNLAKLAKAGLERDAVAATTHALLGATYLALGETTLAKQQMTAAVRIQPEVTLEARAGDEAAALLAEARAAVTAAKTVDCAALRGIAHELVTRADAGTPVPLVAHTGSELKGAQLVVGYAAGDGDDFQEVPMAPRAGCAHAGEIPADAVLAGSLRYFVAAKNADGRLLASKGSARSPFLIDVRAPSDPGGSEATAEGGEAVEDEIPDAIQPVAPKQPRKGGCAGCVAARGDTGGAGVLALLAAALLVRRRRR